MDNLITQFLIHTLQGLLDTFAINCHSTFEQVGK